MPWSLWSTFCYCWHCSLQHWNHTLSPLAEATGCWILWGTNPCSYQSKLIIISWLIIGTNHLWVTILYSSYLNKMSYFGYLQVEVFTFRRIVKVVSCLYLCPGLIYIYSKDIVSNRYGEWYLGRVAAEGRNIPGLVTRSGMQRSSGDAVV